MVLFVSFTIVYQIYVIADRLINIFSGAMIDRIVYIEYTPFIKKYVYKQKCISAPGAKKKFEMKKNQDKIYLCTLSHPNVACKFGGKKVKHFGLCKKKTKLNTKIYPKMSP